MATIFTVTSADLARLNPAEATDIFRALLWSEASMIGVAKSLIDVPGSISSRDDGIDAQVRDVVTAGGQGLIKKGLTRYQIKTGGFSIQGLSDVKEILFQKGSPGELKQGIKSCLDAGGTLVIVLFGWNGPPLTEGRKRVEKLRAALAGVDSKYGGAKIELWGQSQLIGFMTQYPSIALRVNQREHLRFQTHSSWALDAEMMLPFNVGTIQAQRIQDFRNGLRDAEQAIHIRVCGEPGIGKTRLVLEALRTDDLAPLVIYSLAEKFRDSDLMNEILRDDNNFSSVLVLDECDEDARSYIWNKLRYRGARVKIVSVYSEFDGAGGDINYVDAPPLEDEKVSLIIQGYGIPKDQADRFASLCDGSPRVAHVLGSNLRSNPEDLLRTPGTVEVWQRYIVGGERRDSPDVAPRRLILRHIALFKRFGYRQPFESEGKAVQELVNQADKGITWAQFSEIVENLRRRRILQGETTLYITPKAFHIRLWTDWWNAYEATFQYAPFMARLSGRMREWFYDMFEYAANSEASQRVARRLLGEDGPFHTDEFLKSKLEAKLFLALAEADPNSALQRLKLTIGVWDIDRLRKFSISRREVVWALEKIVVWEQYFQDAARLLLALAEAENESWANNATGVFAGLFSPGYGRVAPTEASPEQRFPVLKEALESSSKQRRLLALQACDRALEAEFFVGRVQSEYQGLSLKAKLWTPKTYGELFDAYRRVWQLLLSHLKAMPRDEQQEAVQILLRRAAGLTRMWNLADMVVETMDELAHEPGIDTKPVIKTIVEILHYRSDHLPPQAKQRLEQIKTELTESDFSSRMKRYVGMALIEDRIEGEAEQRIVELAQLAFQDPSLLENELPWLSTNEAENAYQFGFAIGKLDKKLTLLNGMLDALKKAGAKGSAFLIGGYLRAPFERDQERWEELLDSLADEDTLRGFVPEITWRSGFTDRAGQRVLRLARSGSIDIRSLGMFSYGGVIRKLSETAFAEWIEFLLGTTGPDAVSIALDLTYFYYMMDESPRVLPRRLFLELLTHRSIAKKSASSSASRSDEHSWGEMTMKFIEQYPQDRLSIAHLMLQHYGETGTIFEGFHSPTNSVLNKIAQQEPAGLWKLITKYIGPPVDSRAFAIGTWLRSGGFAALGQLDEVWQWTEEDPAKRASYVASFVPNTLFREPGKVCWARELLVRYGQLQSVRSALFSNFNTEGWSGLASTHYENKKQGLLAFKAAEENQNVRDWIEEFVNWLNKQIAHEMAEEEREH